MRSVVLTFFILVVLDHPGESQTQFIWPLKKMPSYSEVPDYYILNNYIDQNTAAGTSAIQDWNCGSRTYDGHRGIDIDLWPFFWSMMDNNYVAVVAAAPGRVVAVDHSQNNENNCGVPPTGNLNWNYIAIRHADSSTSIYGHIRNNSAQVSVGQTVIAGQVIAFVGSSGNSSNPHLHFEVNSTPVTNSQVAGLIDPYQGSCNLLNFNSWWLLQKPYREPAIVRVMTHGNRPALAGYNNNGNFCRPGEAINAKSNFAFNDSIYFSVAIRDFLAGQSYTVSVFDPNNNLWFSSNITASATQNKSFATIDQRIPGGSVSGTYSVVVNFNGTSAVHFFSVNCPSTQNVTSAISGWRGFKSSNTITSTAIVTAGNRLLLQAATRITLSPGFVASDGSILKARIRDCNYSE
ncbi:MAG: M23 family metallopeptidase [Chitinophagaceae bacterium]|nr:M23 family metallopeptidase [Chitinophagaceae bacterium]